MSDFIFALLLLLLILISAFSSGISNGIFSLNQYQIRRKAQLGNKDAKIVYPFKALGYQLLVTLLIINITANATIAIMLDSKTGGLFAVLFSTGFILIFGEILPMIYMRKYVVYVTARVAPVLHKVITFMTPITRPIAHILDKWVGNETQVFYSKEELINMLNGQKLATESGVAVDEARMLRTVLEFDEKLVRDVMTPRRMASIVTKDDEVGPLLMDELHKSGYSRFPVIAEEKHFSFVGTLYLRDLVGETGTKKVKDLMSPHVRYMHEEESLDHALRAFLKTHHHLFVVVNNFEEFVGVLSIEDVLEEIIGREIIDEFDNHEDLRAVAKSLAEKERKKRLTAQDSVKNSPKVIK